MFDAYRTYRSLHELLALLDLAIRRIATQEVAELRALYARAHFFVHPSEMGPDGDQEGVPNSMLEAMASGLPVAATLHGGIPEAVEQNVSGVLVEERNPAALAQAMLILARDATRYERMGAAAAARVSAALDLEAQTRLLESYYREATIMSARTTD